MRAEEYSTYFQQEFDGEVRVNLCGLGEPLINPLASQFVAEVTAKGFVCTLSSNGALLTEEKSKEVLQGGLKNIYLNISELGDSYKDIYNLPFNKTRDNVVRFLYLAKDNCDVYICIVNHHGNNEYILEQKKYWKALGFSKFVDYDLINRGGALFVYDMQYDAMPEKIIVQDVLKDRGITPLCPTPFRYVFVGWDGQYYLCCSDWKKEVPLGSVFDYSIKGVERKKIAHVKSRKPICSKCNHDMLNRLIDVKSGKDYQEDMGENFEACVDTVENIDKLITSYMSGELREKLQNNNE